MCNASYPPYQRPPVPASEDARTGALWCLLLCIVLLLLLLCYYTVWLLLSSPLSVLLSPLLLPLLLADPTPARAVARVG